MQGGMKRGFLSRRAFRGLRLVLACGMPHLRARCTAAGDSRQTPPTVHYALGFTGKIGFRRTNSIIFGTETHHSRIAIAIAIDAATRVGVRAVHAGYASTAVHTAGLSKGRAGVCVAKQGAHSLHPHTLFTHSTHHCLHSLSSTHHRTRTRPLTDDYN